MEILRTPKACFDGIDGFPWSPTYRHVTDAEGNMLRIASIETGPADGPVVLLMHGEPTWSYLYRHMIPLFEQAGCRAICPDLVGFGRSDKPADLEDYTYARHVDWMRRWLDETGLEAITLVCQDWGGLLGLRLVAAQPERFSRVVTANTGLPTGDHQPTEGFMKWRHYSQKVPDFSVSAIVDSGTQRELTIAERAAYDAPFPDDRFKAGARRFPALVPIDSQDPEARANRAAWATLRDFDRPWLTAFSDRDPVTRGGEKPFQKLIPGAQGQNHVTMNGAGHFLQEDVGPELARTVLSFMGLAGGD
ncbi:haloalkane dehalogenase [Ectothiorhodospiraceae bacterium WFHF3C12]|nr:haloalkane dehalogenase [Ectothiorhodospiraceae bacterium WFHF3C12]